MPKIAKNVPPPRNHAAERRKKNRIDTSCKAPGKNRLRSGGVMQLAQCDVINKDDLLVTGCVRAMDFVGSFDPLGGMANRSFWKSKTHVCFHGKYENRYPHRACLGNADCRTSFVFRLLGPGKTPDRHGNGRHSGTRQPCPGDQRSGPRVAEGARPVGRLHKQRGKGFCRHASRTAPGHRQAPGRA